MPNPGSIRLRWGPEERQIVHDAVKSMLEEYPLDIRIQTILTGFASQQMVLDLYHAELRKLAPERFKDAEETVEGTGEGGNKEGPE